MRIPAAQKVKEDINEHILAFKFIPNLAKLEEREF